MPTPPFASTSYSGKFAPPGRPKMVSTPSRRKDSITICAPVYSLSSVVILVPRNRFLSIPVIDASNGGFVSARKAGLARLWRVIGQAGGLGQCPARVPGGGRLPPAETPLYLLLAQFHLDRTVGNIHSDGVAFFDDRDGAADRGFRRDMPVVK